MTVQTQKFASSYKFAELSKFNLETSQDIEGIANQHLDAIIGAFQIIKINYDEWRAEYNSSRPTNERLYLTPYLRTVEDVRRNIYLVWVRICSESYLGKLNTGGAWKPREIKRNGKRHYNKQTLESELSSYTKSCIDYIMDAEHCMTYLREQLDIATLLFKTSRIIKPSGYGLLLAKSQLQQLNESEQVLLDKFEDDMISLKINVDPLSLPKKLTQIQFDKNQGRRRP
jgi:hypothetical protein